MPTLFAGALMLLLVAGCGDGAARRKAPDRDTFIATYVDLRREALTSPSGVVGPERRDEILSRHGVTEEDLLSFVDAHGRDVAYMAGLWGEVEQRMQAPPEPEADR